MLRHARATVATVLFVASSLTAQTPTTVPSTIPFHGRLSLQSNGSVVSGNVKMVAAIYKSPTGGTALWTETHAAIAVNGGLFKMQLGSVKGFPTTLFDGSTLYVGLKMGTDSEMSPRFQMTSQAYSQTAGNAKDVKGADIFRELAPKAPIDLAEGHRYLARMVRFGLEHIME